MVDSKILKIDINFDDVKVKVYLKKYLDYRYTNHELINELINE